MLAIKLQRVGKKHQPSYRVVVAERRSKMAAPPVEDLGSYSPFTKVATIKKERIAHWVKMGAQPTITAHNLLVKEGVITNVKKVVKMPKAVAKAAAPVEVEKAPAQAESHVSTSSTSEEPVVEAEAISTPTIAEAEAEAETPKVAEVITEEPVAEAPATAKEKEVDTTPEINIVV